MCKRICLVRLELLLAGGPGCVSLPAHSSPGGPLLVPCPETIFSGAGCGWERAAPGALVCCVPEPGCPHGAAVLGETCSSGSWCHTPGGWFETLCGWKLCCLILVLLPSHSRLLVNGRCLLSEKLLPGHCCPFPSAELLFRWLLSLGIARCHRRWAGLGARCRHMGNIPVPPGLILGMSITPGG